ncbi:hypothetical protein NDU88_007170 [Pleurodeles waltl]|uniref:Uncharacterized protein n=1 Tax=Pleurodeles waltl TaxID=8319 RepID=A0AAV7NWL5_PLEWA|nr:hypothetical protein NDU88_007170 [Pleurodeles waltl]
MGTGLRGVSSKLKIRDRRGTALSPNSAARAASFLGSWARGLRATHLAPVARDQRPGVQPRRSATPYPAQAREPPPYGSPLRHQHHYVHFAGAGYTEPVASPLLPQGAPIYRAKSKRPLHHARLARPQRSSWQASPCPGARPRLSGGGALVQGLTLSGLPLCLSSPVSRSPDLRGGDQRSRSRRSPTHRGLQVTACSRHFARRTRHSHRRRPRQRAGPGAAETPPAIFRNLPIRTRPAFAAWAVPTPVPEVLANYAGNNASYFTEPGGTSIRLINSC